jgi:hypothetical protein
MELQFNELSIVPCADKYVANDNMKQFVETIATARQKGFRQIRSHHDINQIILSGNYSLFDWLNNREISMDYKQFLYGMIVVPFINEEDSELEEQYIEANYFFEDKENAIEKVECVGLAGAYLYETLSVSLSTHSVWDKVKLSIIVEKNNEIFSENILNVSSKASFGKEEIAEFIENTRNLTLIETTLHPDEKAIHLADHHGKAELKTLCDQLKNSPYVIEMRSTDWGGKKFIRKFQKNGVVEIVLFQTQRQYALQVQTTGDNLRATKAIADVLEQKYS